MSILLPGDPIHQEAPETPAERYARTQRRLETMYRYASRTGRKVGGYTAEQLYQIMLRLPPSGEIDWDAERAGRLAAPRDLKCTLSAEEFQAICWAAKRTTAPGPGGPQTVPMAEFYRRALLAALRGVVLAQIERGKSVPPNIAALVADHR
jgi:hypothetical protein